MSQLEHKRILVVDDDPLFCEAASACLRKAGFDVDVAYDGLDAIERINPGRHMAALIDLDMPKVDGARLIGLLRGDRRLNGMAIVVASGARDIRAYEAALGLGADNFLVKPANWKWLPLLIRHEVNRRRALAELIEFQWRMVTAPTARKKCSQSAC